MAGAEPVVPAALKKLRWTGARRDHEPDRSPAIRGRFAGVRALNPHYASREKHHRSAEPGTAADQAKAAHHRGGPARSGGHDGAGGSLLPAAAGPAVGHRHAARLLIGLLVFAGLTVWQVRAIAGSRYPGLRAAEALGLTVPLYLLLFASTYFLMERASAANFTQPLTRTDALYFSVTVFTTVGFGDITAKSETARVVLIVQMLADLALLGAGARYCWGRCSTAGNEVPAPATARPPADALPGTRHLTSIHRAALAARWQWRHRRTGQVRAVARPQPP